MTVPTTIRRMPQRRGRPSRRPMIVSDALGRALAAGALVLVVAGGCAGSAPGARSIATSDAISPSVASATPSPATTTTPTPSASPFDGLSLLVIGDSIGIPEMGCGSCTGFDERYRAFLEDRSGRTVQMSNEARPDAEIADLQGLLDQDARIREAVAEADVIVVTIGFNNGPFWGPDDPCHVAATDTAAEWVVNAAGVTEACIDETVAQYADKLDRVYASIADLAGDRTQVRVALGVFDNLRDNPGDGTLGTVPAKTMATVINRYAYATARWNERDCEVARSHDFVCGGLYRAFNGSDGAKSVKELVNMRDFVHPNEAGQAKIAELLQELDVSTVTGS